MLVRAYRFTDKLGVVFLKSSIALVDTMLDGLSMIWRRIAIVLAFIGGILWLMLRPIFALFGLLFGGGQLLLGFTHNVLGIPLGRGSFLLHQKLPGVITQAGAGKRD